MGLIRMLLNPTDTLTEIASHAANENFQKERVIKESEVYDNRFADLMNKHIDAYLSSIWQNLDRMHNIPTHEVILLKNVLDKTYNILSESNYKFESINFKRITGKLDNISYDDEKNLYDSVFKSKFRYDFRVVLRLMQMVHMNKSAKEYINAYKSLIEEIDQVIGFYNEKDISSFSPPFINICIICYRLNDFMYAKYSKEDFNHYSLDATYNAYSQQINSNAWNYDSSICQKVCEYFSLDGNISHFSKLNESVRQEYKKISDDKEKMEAEKKLESLYKTKDYDAYLEEVEKYNSKYGIDEPINLVVRDILLDIYTLAKFNSYPAAPYHYNFDAFVKFFKNEYISNVLVQEAHFEKFRLPFNFQYTDEEKEIYKVYISHKKGEQHLMDDIKKRIDNFSSGAVKDELNTVYKDMVTCIKKSNRYVLGEYVFIILCSVGLITMGILDDSDWLTYGSINWLSFLLIAVGVYFLITLGYAHFFIKKIDWNLKNYFK